MLAEMGESLRDGPLRLEGAEIIAGVLTDGVIQDRLGESLFRHSLPRPTSEVGFETSEVAVVAAATPT